MNTAPLQNTADTSPPVSKSPYPGLLLQRKCTCGGSASSSLTGECENCKKTRLQKKLNIGASNDPLEQEADRVADQVLAAPAPSVVNATTPHIQSFTGHPTSDGDIALHGADRAFASSGWPLDTATHYEMKKHFGHDFSRVRVHTGAFPVHSVRDENALAYTLGNTIEFGSGISRFAPESQEEGQQLLTLLREQPGKKGNSFAHNHEQRGLSNFSVPSISSVSSNTQLQMQEETEFDDEEGVDGEEIDTSEEDFDEEDEQETEGSEPVMLKRDRSNSSVSKSAPFHIPSGHGHALDAVTSGFMKQRFGYDFSAVRIHNDRDAAESARRIHAQAYTSGSDIYFNEGRYNPAKSEGLKLLAHELTHVIQQKGTPPQRIQRKPGGTPPATNKPKKPEFTCPAGFKKLGAFKLTSYVLAQESEFPENPKITDPCGLKGTFRKTFLLQTDKSPRGVKTQGSGRSIAGDVIHYKGNDCFEVVNCPVTKSGACATSGRTVAVDPAVIKLGSELIIEDVGSRVAEDTGGAINGAHIDVYRGTDITMADALKETKTGKIVCRKLVKKP